MKKLFSFVATMALALGLTTACEDVPAPYGLPTDPMVNPENDPNLLLDASFASKLDPFKNYLTSGEGGWVIDRSYAKATGYNGQATVAGTYYLVSPEIDLTKVDAAHLTYEYIIAYNRGDENQQVLITDNFDEKKADQNWTAFNYKMVANSGKPADWKAFEKADIDIPAAFLGKKIRIAFRYNCGTNGSTWEVKNVKLQKGKAEGATPQPEQPKPAGQYINETFSSSLGSFTSVLGAGKGAWIIEYNTAKATGFDNATKKTTAGTYYLVSPEFDLTSSKGAHIAFEYIVAYNKGDENQQLLITDSYNEKDVNAGWTTINQTWNKEFTKDKNGKPAVDWAKFHKADFNVPAQFLGKKVRIAFRYNTNDKSGSTWEVKNLIVADGAAANQGGNVEPQPQPQPNPSEPAGEIFNAKLDVDALGWTLNEGGKLPAEVAQVWKHDTKFKCLKATAYVSATKKRYESEAWAVTPLIRLKDNNVLKFEHAAEYLAKGESIKDAIALFVRIGENGKWEPLEIVGYPTVGTNKFPFASSGDISLSKYNGQTVQFGFRYKSTTTSACTWEIKNVVVR